MTKAICETKPKRFSRVFSKSTCKHANRRQLVDTKPCTLPLSGTTSHILSEAPQEKLQALPLSVLELSASTSLLEAEGLYLISNLNVFMTSSHSFILMPILSFSLNVSFPSLVFYLLSLFVSIKTGLKLVS